MRANKVIEELKEKAEYAEQKAAEYEEKGDTARMDIWDAKARTYRNSIKIVIKNQSKVEGITDKEIIENLDNAWMALTKQYKSHPDEGTRHSMNILAKIIGKIKNKAEQSQKTRQITMEEWLILLQKN